MTGDSSGKKTEMKESEERFRLLVESVRDYAIFMLDPEGHVLTWNAGAQRFKGYRADEIIGQHFSRFYPAGDVEAGKPDEELRNRLQNVLRASRVEFRRGASGGGNQLRQPYLRQRFPSLRPEDYPQVDHVHFFGFYLGNYPALEPARIQQLCALLNRV